MKLFPTVVTPTALYGCSSWVMTCDRETKLQSTQLKMIRSIIGTKRLANETWVDNV